ncbi:hypothetical protein MYX77_08700 [Acidobacteriia bacterium AH_259_A11_L15]|nr:hypothetical protein [Acidobacteriia bacterium AH_259_A11_L15]
MRDRAFTRLFACLLSVLLASPLFSPLSAAETPVALGRIVSAPAATLNGVEVPAEATLLAGGEQIHLGARSQARARNAGGTGWKSS